MSATLDAVCAETAPQGPPPAGATEIAGTIPAMLESLRQSLGTQAYNVWFKAGTRLSVEGQTLRVLVPNSFIAKWIESHYVPQISAAAADTLGLQGAAVLVCIEPQLASSLRKGRLDTQAQQVELATQGRCRERATPTELRHKLDDFVVGESNRLAYSAALAVAGAAPPPFNPLFVHGSCGVGKTHLLQGLCHLASQTRRNGEALRCRYVTAEAFTNEFVGALRQRHIEEFRARYRPLDLLVIDDVHFLASKKATQDEFLHTFNTIQSAGRQVVMASDAHPRMVGELNEQLVSRFLAGMVVKIEAPDNKMRLEILRRRVAALKLNVAGEVLEYVAMHIRTSVRELEGAALKLSAIAALSGGTVTLSMAAQALDEHLSRTDSAITLGDIESAVAAYFGVTPADLHCSRRTRPISQARMITMFLARRHTRMSYPEIGKFMGKNHSSAVLAVQRMEKLLGDNGKLSWQSKAGMRSMRAREIVELLSNQVA